MNNFYEQEISRGQNLIGRNLEQMKTLLKLIKGYKNFLRLIQNEEDDQGFKRVLSLIVSERLNDLTELRDSCIWNIKQINIELCKLHKLKKEIKSD